MGFEAPEMNKAGEHPALYVVAKVCVLGLALSRYSAHVCGMNEGKSE